MESNLVSVVIPIYNGARFLSKAIESVLAQSYQAIELILVDDGSTDESPELIESYGSRVVAVRQNNQGVAHARNTGILHARGEFIAFLDQDDWWMPEKIEKQVRILSSDNRLGLVHTGVQHYDDIAAAVVGPLNPTARPAELIGDCYERLLCGNCVYNSSVMVRTSVLHAAGAFDTTIPGNTVQDYDMWLRIARRSTFAYLPDELLTFRLHPGQGTWNRRQMLTQELHLLERHTAYPTQVNSKTISGRLATLWYELGIAHLDANERERARSCFSRSILTRWSTRVGLLYVATCLPHWAIEWLRKTRGTIRRLASRYRGANGAASLI